MKCFRKLYTTNVVYWLVRMGSLCVDAIIAIQRSCCSAAKVSPRIVDKALEFILVECVNDFSKLWLITGIKPPAHSRIV